MTVDLDAIEAAVAGWRGVFAARPAEEYDNGGPMVANVVRLGPRLAYLPDDGDEDDAEAWTDIGDMDPHCHPSLAVLLNAPGPLLAEIRTLRADLAAKQAIINDLVAERRIHATETSERIDEIHELRDLLAAARLSAWLLMWQAVGIAHSEATVIEVYVDAMENRRDVCAHCQAEHDVPSGAMAAHVRECEQNPMAVELRAARLDAANARSVAVEAIALLDARLNPRTIEGYVFKDEAEAQLADLRTRLASPADFAARVTAALDRLVLVAASEFPGSAKVDAARAEADAAIGVARG